MNFRLPRTEFSARPSASARVAVVIAIGCAAVGCQPAAVTGSLTEPMELQGRWLGMRLVAVDSTSARELGVPSTMSGVVVAELLNNAAARTAQAGITPGDVIVAVDGARVVNLAELYTLTTRKNVTQPIAVDVLRQGQAITALVPSAFTAGFAPPAQAVVQDTTGGAPLFCPNDGLHWTAAQVAPDFRCPRCGGALLR